MRINTLTAKVPTVARRFKADVSLHPSWPFRLTGTQLVDEDLIWLTGLAADKGTGVGHTLNEVRTTHVDRAEEVVSW